MTPTPILYSLQGAMFSISTRIPYSHNTRLFSKSHSNPLLSVSHKPRSSISTNTAREEQEQEDDFRVLTATKTEYNNIIILESHGSKLLLLDDSCNVHSILYKDQIWTNSYWDEFTSLPAITTPGPIAVFGLGGGTIAHQLLHFCPTLCLHGWELDEILIDRARQFLGLSVLETANESGGILHVHVGDALLHSASVEGGFAGIIVDLFSNAKVLPELEQVDTWLEMKKKLMPNGRIMVNCGGEISLIEKGKWEENLTIQAMCGAFGKKLVNWKKMSKSESGNYLAFTGQLPEVHYWSTAVPEKLRATVALWKACEP